MAAWIRNDTWKCDEELKRDLEGYVKLALKRDEVLDFVSKKYPMYGWSLHTLCCRLHYFDITQWLFVRQGLYATSAGANNASLNLHRII